jgi:hypothetical protein
VRALVTGGDLKLLTESLIAGLWGAAAGGGEVYAVLDAARDRHIYRTLVESPLGSQCLYEGPLPKALAETAPYLVRLKPRNNFTEKLFDEGFSKSWGIFLCSPAPELELRRHLRTFLMVADDRGQFLYFRYYDPRVFRVYLPTCNELELEAVFGPVERFFCESDGGRSMVEYGRRGPALVQSALQLTAPGEKRC